MWSQGEPRGGKPGPDTSDFCLSSRGFDRRSARPSENRRRGRGEALPRIPMSALMTETHFLSCPTCPSAVLPAGLCLRCCKKTERPSAGSFLPPTTFSSVYTSQLLHLIKHSLPSTSRSSPGTTIINYFIFFCSTCRWLLTWWSSWTCLQFWLWSL